MDKQPARHTAPAGRHLAPAGSTAAPRRTAPRHSGTQQAPRRRSAERAGQTAEPEQLPELTEFPEELSGQTGTRRERSGRHSAPETENIPADIPDGEPEELSDDIYGDGPEDTSDDIYDDEPEELSGGRRAGGHRVARTKPKWFRICLLVYLGILLVLSGYLQIKLWLYLGRSQAEMDRQAADQAARKAYEDALYQAPQRAFEDWRTGQTAEQWADLWYARGANEMETREGVGAYLKQLFSPEGSQAYKDPTYTDETPVYIVKDGDKPLARVTLSGEELSWGVSNVELLLTGDRTATITVPDVCGVSFNGMPLGDEYRQREGSLIQLDTLKQLLVNPITWSTYTVEGLLAEPEITVEPPTGYEIFQDDAGRYMIIPGLDTSSYAEDSVSFVRAFLNYYMNGYHATRSHMNTVLGFLRKDSQAYQDILDTYESVNWASYYGDIDTSKTEAGAVIAWSENCFSIDVTYDADASMLGEAVDYANATMRLYYVRSDSGFYISHFETL